MNDTMKYVLTDTGPIIAALLIWTGVRFDDLRDGHITQQRMIVEQAMVIIMVTVVWGSRP